ncbi:MAG: hypothetical protein CML81_04850 [Rhodobiaceae bacterium]|nr:hypothetical protein [Rhodobiaceae bacterium]RPF96547.1 MAG: methyltransferase domain-containing protein [Rhizobiales bacterium TMED227]
MTKYVEAIIKSDLSIDELDDDYLFEKGIISISQANIGEDQCVSFHFDKKNETNIIKIIQSVFGKFINFNIKNIPKKNWVLETQKNLKPIISKDIIIRNDNYSRSKYSNIDVCINASMAFGTGHHGTTHGCIEALSDLSKNRKINNFLDIGTGSGILSIISSKLWYCSGIAIDNDPVAIEITKINFKKNNVNQSITYKVLDIMRDCKKLQSNGYDLIIVNILANVINKVRFDLKRLLDNNGILILSGITYSQKRSILMYFLSIGFIKLKEIQYAEWITLTLVYCKSNQYRK